MNQKEYGPAHTTQEERFEGFAMAHLLLSALCWPLFWLGMLSMDSFTGAVALAWVVLLAYFPMGMAVAWLNGWTVPVTERERWQAVAWPTAVAWAWVGVVLFAVLVPAEGMIMMVFLVSLFLAAPSSALVLVTLPLWGGLSSAADLALGLALIGMAAGVLPTCLFAWGSFFQAGRAEKRRAGRAAPSVEP